MIVKIMGVNINTHEQKNSYDRILLNYWWNKLLSFLVFKGQSWGRVDIKIQKHSLI